MERLKCNLTFRELRKDENLYDDVDLTAGGQDGVCAPGVPRAYHAHHPCNRA